MDPLRRTHILASAVLVATATLLAGMVGRVAWIERNVTPETAERLRRQYTAVIPVAAQRASMNFADGTPAAMSVRVFSLFADPAFIVDPTGKLNPLKGDEVRQAQEMLAEALAPLVEKPARDLKFDIKDNVYYKREDAPGVWTPTDKPRRFLWLARDVDEDFYNRFMALREKLHADAQALLKGDGRSKDPATRTAAARKAAVLAHALDGVGFVRSLRRVYPMGAMAASVIGYANRDEGVDGMERQLDPLLRGINGSMHVIKDAQRVSISVQDDRYTAPDHGCMVWLTLDPIIQGIAEEQLKQAVEQHGAVRGTAVVLDPFSGKILAMANYPGFDPAKFGETEGDVRRNRAATDPYEPGSIWKPFVMAWALEKGVVKPTDKIDCRQGTYIDPTGRVVRDTHGVGEATVADVLIKSSNIGMTQIGWKMGVPMMHEGAVKFGFGTRTGAELPGDEKGLVKPLSQWNKGTMTSASFGYEVSATPLQLVRAYATFANGGYLVTPHIINAVETTPGKAVPWSELSPQGQPPAIIRPETAQTMRDIMKEVLVRGTARTAASKVYSMFGKTGTAHVAAVAHGIEGRGYGERDYDSSFLVGGPCKDPRLVAIVTLHRPDLKTGYYGGTVAAPAAVAIMERSLMYLQVPGDLKPAQAGPATQPVRRVAAR